MRLPRNFVVSRYAVDLVVDPARDGFTGKTSISGEVSERSSVIWLHADKLTITSARAIDLANGPSDGQLLTATPRGEDLLELRADPPLERGSWTIALDYAGSYDTLATAGLFKQTIGADRYLYTQLEATFARRVFPCLDEPDVKVPWQLTLEVPANLVALSNSAIASESPLANGHRRVEFAQTKPMPSYLVAFAVGPFEVLDAGKTRSGVPLRVVTLAKRASEGAWAQRTLPAIVAALEDWFAIPYPYDKLDVVTIPLTVGFGAMENAGLITFTEEIILIDPIKASRYHQHDWVVVAAHELAHQWFGNLVTMKFWDDIWLNEGFANWLERKVTGAIDATYRDDQTSVTMARGALTADALVSARAVRQSIDTADDIANVFDSITYDKGAALLAMFERFIGPEQFRAGVRRYLADHAWGNATSSDFAAAIEQVSHQPRIGAALATFLEQPGAPELATRLTCTADGALLEIGQRLYLPPGAPPPASHRPWIIPVCVVYDRGNGRGETCGMIDEHSNTIALSAARCPRWAMINADGAGYFRVSYTAAQATAIRDEAWHQLTWKERRSVFADISDAVGNATMPLATALSFVPRMLAGGDRFTVLPVVWFAGELDRWVPDGLRFKFEHWVRTTFGPAATATGVVAKESDTLDGELLRSGVISTVAWLGRDPAIVAEIGKLADRWRELPQATRSLVLHVAADARPELFDQLVRELPREPSRRLRREMLEAIGGVRDGDRLRRALELTLDPKNDIREMIELFDGPSERALAAAQQFFRDHKDALLARLPRDATTDSLADRAELFTKTCRADARAAVVDYVTKTFASLPGGKRSVAQAIEGMDQCIARRGLLEPEVAAWLVGLRLPKPK